MTKARTTTVQLRVPYRVAGMRYNAGDVVRLPRRLASTLVASRRARLAADSAVTGSTVMDLHESARRGIKPIALRPYRETKADGVPETKPAPERADSASAAFDDDGEGEYQPVELCDVVDDVKRMRVPELRIACERNGLSTEGLKAQLQRRLVDHLRSCGDD